MPLAIGFQQEGIGMGSKSSERVLRREETQVHLKDRQSSQEMWVDRRAAPCRWSATARDETPDCLSFLILYEFKDSFFPCLS